MIQRTVPVRAEHDEVGLMLRGLLDNVIDSETNQRNWLDFDAGGDERRGERLQARIRRGEAFGRLGGRRSCSNDIHRRPNRYIGSHWLDDMQKDDSGR